MKKIIFILCFIMIFILTGCAKENYVYFTVTFISEGEVIFTQEVIQGETAKCDIVPELEGYTFTGWDIDITDVQEDLVANAMFEISEYTVKFYDEEGNVLNEQTVKHGDRPTVPQAPKKLGYKFVKWDTDYKNVASDLDINPIYELQTYTITYIDENGKKIEGLSPSTYTILDGGSLELPPLIEKEGYECLGWYQGNTRVVTFFSSDAENKVYQLKYKELPKPMEIPSDSTFLFDTLKVVPIANSDKTTTQPDFNDLPYDTNVLNWEWSSLHPDVATISVYSSISKASAGFAIIKAVNKSDPKLVGYMVIKVTNEGIYISSIEEATTKVEYTVTFTDDNGNIIESQKVEQYKSAVLPTAPLKEGYTFIGWSDKYYNITGDITLEANYIEGESNFLGKTVSILGDSISTYKGYVPEGYSCFYPYPTADLSSVSETWWMQTIDKLGMELLKNNSYSGTCVSSGTGAYSGVQDARLQELLKDGQSPDVIFLFMGANDCGSSSVSLNTFTSSYKIMLEKIIQLCPDSKIYVMTLPPSNLYKESDRVKYNEVITSYANEFDLVLINMDNAYNGEDCAKYLVDSAHQNLAGMTKLSECLVYGLLKSEGIELK